MTTPTKTQDITVFTQAEIRVWLERAAKERLLVTVLEYVGGGGLYPTEPGWPRPIEAILMKRVVPVSRLGIDPNLEICLGPVSSDRSLIWRFDPAYASEIYPCPTRITVHGVPTEPDSVLATLLQAADNGIKVAVTRRDGETIRGIPVRRGSGRGDAEFVFASGRVFAPLSNVGMPHPHDAVAVDASLSAADSEWFPGTDPRVREWTGRRVEARHPAGALPLIQAVLGRRLVTQPLYAMLHADGSHSSWASDTREFRLLPDDPDGSCSSAANHDKPETVEMVGEPHGPRCSYCRDTGVVDIEDDYGFSEGLCHHCDSRKDVGAEWVLHRASHPKRTPAWWNACRGSELLSFTTYPGDGCTLANGDAVARAFGKPTVYVVHGEHCHEMAAQRVLCALRGKDK